MLHYRMLGQTACVLLCSKKSRTNTNGKAVRTSKTRPEFYNLCFETCVTRSTSVTMYGSTFYIRLYIRRVLSTCGSLSIYPAGRLTCIRLLIIVLYVVFFPFSSFKQNPRSMRKSPAASQLAKESGWKYKVSASAVQQGAGAESGARTAAAIKGSSGLVAGLVIGRVVPVAC